MGFFSYSQAHPSHDKADEIQLEHLGYAQARGGRTWG